MGVTRCTHININWIASYLLIYGRPADSHWIISVTFPVMLSAIYMFAAEKTINPLEGLKHKKRKIQEHKYSQFNFDISLLEKLKLEKDNLKNEIDELNKSAL